MMPESYGVKSQQGGVAPERGRAAGLYDEEDEGDDERQRRPRITRVLFRVEVVVVMTGFYS